VKRSSRQTVDNSNRPQEVAKNLTWLDHIDEESLLVFPGKEEWRKAFIHTLYTWFDNPEHLVLEEFCISHRINRKNLWYLRDRYPDIGDAVKEIKILLGARRRKGAMTFKLHYASAYRDMHVYDSEWKSEVDEYHAKLKNEADKDTNTGTQYIYEKIIEYRDKPVAE